MALWELVLIAVGLSMDAFAVSICRGLEMRRIDYRRAAVIAVFFGGFQAAMPLIGYFFGAGFARYLRDFDHWIAFGLLAFIGVKMIREAVRGGACEACALNLRALVVMAFATSVDALAAGLTFALLKVDILRSALLIGATTFVLSFLGVAVGNRVGARFQRRAGIAGGAVLVGIGLKLLAEHLGAI